MRQWGCTRVRRTSCKIFVSKRCCVQLWVHLKHSDQASLTNAAKRTGQAGVQGMRNLADTPPCSYPSSRTGCPLFRLTQASNNNADADIRRGRGFNSLTHKDSPGTYLFKCTYRSHLSFIVEGKSRSCAWSHDLGDLYNSLLILCSRHCDTDRAIWGQYINDSYALSAGHREGTLLLGGFFLVDPAFHNPLFLQLKIPPMVFVSMTIWSTETCRSC